MNANLDLVKVADKAVPPVCKIMDYGKYKFEMSKHDKESKKNQRTVEVKEIRLSVNIDTHDFNTKVAHAMRFVDAGNKVKVSIRFRGREMGHPEIGYDLMTRFSQSCEEFAVVDRPAKLEGRCMLMFLSSKPQSAKTVTKESKKKAVSSPENIKPDETVSSPEKIQSDETISNLKNSEKKGSEGARDVLGRQP